MIAVTLDAVAGLAEYAAIPIAFEVGKVMDVTPLPDGTSSFSLPPWSARTHPIVRERGRPDCAAKPFATAAMSRLCRT